MILETQKLYRGQDKNTGLEAVFFAWITGDGAPGGTLEWIGADIDGNVIRLPWSEVKLNWRWNSKTNDWDDLDAPKGAVYDDDL